MNPIIIIGTGLAGYGLAKAFRQLDKTTPLTLITQDEGYFYSKPMLSNALIKNKTPKDLMTATVEENITQLNASYLNHTHLVSIQPEEKTITIQNGERLSYSKLILAWGASPIQLPHLQNSPHIFSVNHLEDYIKFRAYLNSPSKVAILGSGLIGCEFANDLAHTGHHVTVIAPSRYPLDTLIPEKIGSNLQNALSHLNVQWKLGSTVSHIDSDKKPLLNLSTGEQIEADIVLSAIGIRPKIDIAEKAGIHVRKGILTNAYLETNYADIYAVGDCAEVNGYVLPYIAPIAQCTKALAKTLAGEKTAVNYPPMPITIKTSCYPIAVLPPLPAITGEWHYNDDSKGMCAQFLDENKKLHGFVVTQERLMERFALIPQIEPLF